MEPGHGAVAAAYLEHLSEHDVHLLAQSEPSLRDAVDPRAEMVMRRGGITDLVASEPLRDAIFGAPDSADPFLSASPFLVFAVAVERVRIGLATATFVPEWLGPGRTAPVFDVDDLRVFMADPWHRFFFAELLASYTHVASGSMLVPTRRGMRRRRFSELDPVRLAGLLEVVTDIERPGVLRRLGDLSLFLTGVFPDHIARRGFGQIDEARLLRTATHAAPVGEMRGQVAPAHGPFDGGAVTLLEQLGRRWYRAAYELLPRPVPDSVAILGELPRHFGLARRILGVITDQYLFSNRDQWFGLLGS